MQLQLALGLADDLYDMLLLRGEPVDHVEAASRLLALKAAPEQICREAMDAIVRSDHRFAWSSPNTLSLASWKIQDPDLSEIAFVVLDLETTGMRPGIGKITEIGAVRLEVLREVATFETLVNPQRPIHPKVVEITGITPQMVVNSPRIEQVMPHFLDFLRGAVIVAHNPTFDLSFLNYELGRLNGRRLGDAAIDTVSLARRAAPGLPNYRLGTVAASLGSPVQACHRALADAQATAHVFAHLVGRLQEQGITRLGVLRSFADPTHKGDRHKLALTQDLPKAPGVYLFLDAEGNPLYVGKAENLRERVRSYFLSGSAHSRKVRQAIKKLSRVTHEPLGTSLEAVVKEQQLILEHRPPANIYGRRPENYVYVKLAQEEAGIRLYVSDRRSSRSEHNNGAAPTVEACGPYRGRSRVNAAIELLQRCYPLRRCQSPAVTPCIYGQTDRCLRPCSSEEHKVRHDELAYRLAAWLRGEPAELEETPQARADRLMRRLSREQRYEEAGKVREGVEALQGLRHSHRALRDACSLRFAALWPHVDGSRGREARVNLVWDGQLSAAFNVTRATASLEIGRVLRTLDFESESPGPLISLEQTELDGVMAVRRWVKEGAKGAVLVNLPNGNSPSSAGDRAGGWREAILRNLEDLL